MIDAKEYLQRYKLMTARIKVAEDELKELREARSAISSSLDGMPRGSDLSDRTARLAVQIADKESEILDMQSAAWSIRMDIINTLGKVQVPVHLTLLHLRYIKGYRWEAVASELHYSYQWVAGELHRDALKEIEGIINC